MFARIFAVVCCVFERSCKEIANKLYLRLKCRTFDCCYLIIHPLWPHLIIEICLHLHANIAHSYTKVCSRLLATIVGYKYKSSNVIYVVLILYYLYSLGFTLSFFIFVSSHLILLFPTLWHWITYNVPLRNCSLIEDGHHSSTSRITLLIIVARTG